MSVVLPSFTRHFATLAGDYDVVLCDVWGVVHNGVAAAAEAADALTRFRARGGTGSHARPLPAAVSRSSRRTHARRAGFELRAPLVSRFRSSRTLAALSNANFGIKGTLATLCF